MRSIIFANYLARDTMRLAATIDVEHHHVRFLGDLVLNLWDCGGQDAFYESYFERDRETIFRSVELLIYVFDIASDCPEKDFEHFAGVLEAMEENSPDAKIFVLVHKMDLVAKEEQEMIFADRKRMIEESCVQCGVHNLHCFATSIWDETLYKAWSEIVTNLIPNIRVLESHLDDFCRICDADEVVLFERATFLVISHSHGDRQSIDTDLVNADDNNANVALDNDSPSAIDINSPANIDRVVSPTNGNGVATFLEDEDFTFTSAASSSVQDGTMPSSIDGTNDYQLPSVFSEVTGNDDSLRRQSSTSHLQRKKIDSNVRGGGSKVTSTPSSPNHHHKTKNNSKLHFDTHRFEKISNIVKQFKLSCEKAQSQFQGMEVSNSRFTACIDAFTKNTYIMVIVSDPSVHVSTTLMNVKNARGHFERFIPRS